jgi:hypothetical protein
VIPQGFVELFLVVPGGVFKKVFFLVFFLGCFQDLSLGI